MIHYFKLQAVCCENFFFFRYQSESAELNEWLQDALERLEFWNNQSITVPEELETVRGHLSAFLVSIKLLRTNI